MRAALQFSGGKDSLALVYHLQALLPHIDVVMVDTGDMTDAADRNADLVREIAPNFHVINTMSRVSREVHGDPTSANWIQCCALNIWVPMQEFIRDRGYTQVFRGAKRCDPHFHGVYPGDVVDGVIYTMPLWEWSDADVVGYLGDKCPVQYGKVNGMPDCVTCPVPESCGGFKREVWR